MTTLADQLAALPSEQSALTDYDFTSCQKCGRLVTKPEMIAALGSADGTRPGTGRPCPCGGLKFSPVNLPWWGWCLPRVLVFAWQRLRKQA